MQWRKAKADYYFELTLLHIENLLNQLFYNGKDRRRHRPLQSSVAHTANMEEVILDKQGNLAEARTTPMRLNKLIQAIRQAAASTVTALRRIHKAGVISRINASGTQGTKDLYQYLRRNNAPLSAVMQDPDSLHVYFQCTQAA